MICFRPHQKWRHRQWRHFGVISDERAITILILRLAVTRFDRDVTSCCFLIITPCCERRKVGLLWFMSSVVARFKRGVTSCCYLIIAPLIISADFENFQSSHGCHLRRVVIYLCEIWKSTNRCKILNFESRSSDFDAGDRFKRGVTSCCYLIITPCCDRCRVGLLWFMSSVVTASNAELRHAVILSVPPAMTHYFCWLWKFSIVARLSLASCCDVVIYLCEIWKSTNRCTSNHAARQR